MLKNHIPHALQFTLHVFTPYASRFTFASLKGLPASVLRRSHFTLYALLLTVFMLLFALSSPLVAEAADKLIVKDSGGVPLFKVTDTGKVGIGNTVPVQ